MPVWRAKLGTACALPGASSSPPPAIATAAMNVLNLPCRMIPSLELK